MRSGGARVLHRLPRLRLIVLFASAAGPAAAETAIHVFAAGANTCAVTTQGEVRCWGSNSNGQLGDGTTTPSSVPVAVSGLAGQQTAVTTGDASSCALGAAGGVQCWGWPWSPATGVPVPVPGLGSDVTAIDANAYGLCATTAGGVACEQYDLGCVPHLCAHRIGRGLVLGRR